MKISAWALGWRTLWRDVRAGELRLLIVAVTLAVAALTSVGFFSDRLQSGLQRDALQLLGGDVVVVSDNATPDVFVQEAQKLGLRGSSTLSFPTMARAPDDKGGESKLVALKSVDAAYPLRGNVQTATQTSQAGAITKDIPAAGEAWVDAPLLESLGIGVGDPLLLGDASLKISRVITLEPDRGAGFMSFAPRVLINMQDLQATGLVQPASRITYRYAVAGEVPRAVQQFKGFATKLVDEHAVRGVRIESLDSGRPEMHQTLVRAQNFLNLVALLAALLSAVAVALAYFASREINTGPVTVRSKGRRKSLSMTKGYR